LYVEECVYQLEIGEKSNQFIDFIINLYDPIGAFYSPHSHIPLPIPHHHLQRDFLSASADEEEFADELKTI